MIVIKVLECSSLLLEFQISQFSHPMYSILLKIAVACNICVFFAMGQSSRLETWHING